MNLNLSDRLTALAECIQPGLPLWDICCDHGYLGLSSFSKQKIPQLYLIDQSLPVIENLIASTQKSLHFDSAIIQSKRAQYCFHNGSQIFVEQNSGEKINPSQLSGTVVIAGVGFFTIKEMLDSWGDWLKPQDRLVLSTHQDVYKLREYLAKSPYKLVQEKLILEKHLFREILVLEKLGDEVEKVGSFLNSPFVLEYFNQEIQKAKMILSKSGKTDIPLALLEEKMHSIIHAFQST